MAESAETNRDIANPFRLAALCPRFPVLPVWSGSGEDLPRPSVPGHRAIPKQPLHPGPQAVCLWSIRISILINPLSCRSLGLLQEAHIHGKAGSPEGGQPVLPVSKEIPRSSELQILLCDAKPVPGFAQGFQPGLGIRIPVVGQENAIAFCLAPAHPARS